ncbi:hypothetical protein Hac_1608 [Helicobacter acinonychis str. Sheeba]|uniref:Helix-turn-helix type 11 domain-containing protein n=1 Tax=Helicobacter acinonychis (strain Sheeba) TaxID=382638 RepID=Q17VK9_HELAH|nr:winged helix-turn-helix domain-containing protein [Helicobacter acinonychis]CAK00317.1 hypothetical protein Hac_1608 [Helicobacter acinonychis str. Sheeba]
MHCICNDQRVSDTALAIYVFIKKHATTFKLTIQDIAKRFNKSLPTVYKYLNQLKDLGYIEFERPRRKDGTFMKFVIFHIQNHPKSPYSKKEKKPTNASKPTIKHTKDLQ